MPNPLSKPNIVIFTPSESFAVHAPVTTITNAVNEQIIIVSTNGSNEATKPSCTGCSVLAAACAIGADPWPASFENKPRLTPIVIVLIKTAPANPPVAAVPVKASVTIILKAPGRDL